jgi:hypothetical protein
MILEQPKMWTLVTSREELNRPSSQYDNWKTLLIDTALKEESNAKGANSKYKEIHALLRSALEESTISKESVSQGMINDLYDKIVKLILDDLSEQERRPRQGRNKRKAKSKRQKGVISTRVPKSYISETLALLPKIFGRIYHGLRIVKPR